MPQGSGAYPASVRSLSSPFAISMVHIRGARQSRLAWADAGDAAVPNERRQNEDDRSGAFRCLAGEGHQTGRASSASRQISTRWLSDSANVPTRNVISATPITQ